ncbi:hypothetical protein [Xenorhabdus bovienii]|uniref:Uncharacterized protein n=1 Tax=Xenorhabdus bovienii str. feltiae Moldova TaxID=1398200 RepID=A0A077NW97_XENBV|nr:hypothetical protein [Xenorhabdus bovienii]CDG86374.1 hypothetical protein XBFFR1_1030022 [Xenorhabdus bovienii str. feltiae France]CDG94234.1 hypothetical protein XBFFL1_350002 [Xenorhabdus bovienii str. feltiae Florida]CDH01906.1 hypothetical protein XBFM1_2380019 [Xenorhabdus bovienii str. feltiae Moldova]
MAPIAIFSNNIDIKKSMISLFLVIIIDKPRADKIDQITITNVTTNTDFNFYSLFNDDVIT